MTTTTEKTATDTGHTTPMIAVTTAVTTDLDAFATERNCAYCLTCTAGFTGYPDELGICELVVWITDHRCGRYDPRDNANRDDDGYR